ncbi:MAG: Hsp20/alpha crystallin family protein [Terrimicrobiaceae bacterium]|nr:Hsp20/alpha crystallin family protein [Terrimicrobiaceae bacterium]
MKTITNKQEAPAAAQRVEFAVPRVNIHQDGEGYTLEVEMPGVAKSGVEVTFEDGKLTLVGHPAEGQPSGRAVYRERALTGYRRVFDLDPSIDSEKITASIEQGLLKVRLHKAEAAKPRKITVS